VTVKRRTIFIIAFHVAMVLAFLVGWWCSRHPAPQVARGGPYTLEVLTP